MAEYEDDYDDEGNPIRIKITKAILKSRLAEANEQLVIARRQRKTAFEKATALENRLAARQWADRIAATIDSGPVPFTLGANLHVEQDTVDVSSGPYPQRIAGMVTARLSVEFQGEPDVLKRLGEMLVTR